MSIKMIATELYRAGKNVEKLEEQLLVAPFSEQGALKEELRHAQAEQKQLRKMLDGKKGAASFGSKQNQRKYF